VDGDRIARGFLRRIGDDVPLVVAGEACTPQTLAAVMAMWVVERVVAQEGGHAEQIVLSHPPIWGPYRKQVLHEALWEIGLTNVTLVPKPVTAAESHAFQGFAGRTLAVYALGGTSFATSVVRRTHPAGFEILHSLEGVEPLGGADFDEALTSHVRSVLARQLGAHQLDDPQVRLALFGLRGECARAKERLSAATETDVRLHLPQGPTRIPVTRAQFEEMIRPALQLTVDTLIRTVRSGGMHPDQLDGVLLVGGSARIPLVAELVAAQLPGPVTVEADPQVTTAAGAALAACQIVSLATRRRQDPESRRPAAAIGYPDGDPSMLPQQAPDNYQDQPQDPPPRPPVKITPLKLPRTRTARLVPGRGFMAFGVAIFLIMVTMVSTLAFAPNTSTQAASNLAREYGSEARWSSPAALRGTTLRPGPLS
jgi:actin-like ATPase involved in cell morphogenesis